MATRTARPTAPDPTHDAVEPDEETVADIDTIVPDKPPLVIDGVQCRIRPMKTREFLALMKVLTSGLGGALAQVRIDLTSQETVARDMAALLMLAIPNATEEFMVFLTAVCEPVSDDPKVKAQVARYFHDDPDLDVMMVVFEYVIEANKDDLPALAGKAQAMWTRIAPMFQSKTIG